MSKLNIDVTKNLINKEILKSGITEKLIMESVSDLPEPFKTELITIIKEDGFTGVIPKEFVTTVIKNLDISLYDFMNFLIPAAALYAKPYLSNFFVGVVTHGTTGNLYFGANIEFPGESLKYSLHGEQSSTFNAWSNNETSIDALAAGGGPCGHCRQFLYEVNPKLNIIFPDSRYKLITEILPYTFGPEHLGVSSQLMDTRNNNLELINDTDDQLAKAALAAANKSHSPYTQSYSGLALRTKCGKVFTGSYAENAAFNPSMSPFETAFAVFNNSGIHYSSIEDIILVEQEKPAVVQFNSVNNVVQCLLPNIKLRKELAK